MLQLGSPELQAPETLHCIVKEIMQMNSFTRGRRNIGLRLETVRRPPSTRGARNALPRAREAPDKNHNFIADVASC